MSTCRACGASGVTAAVDLGVQPPADTFPLAGEPDPAAGPLTVGVCPSCGLVQATTPVPGGGLATHGESLSAVSAAQRAHFAQLAAAASDRGITGPVVAHGHQPAAVLSAFGMDAPSETPAALAVDHAGLAHEDDLRAAVERLAADVADGGWLAVELHHALALLESTQFDVLTHEHRAYLTVRALLPLLESAGVRAVSAERLPLYGGTVRVWARRDGAAVADASVEGVLADEERGDVASPERWTALGESAREAARAFAAFLRDNRAGGRTVAGYGAPSRAATLLHLAGAVDGELLAFTVDKSAAKHGRRLPGTAVDIRPPRALEEARPDVIVVFPYDLAPEVVAEWGARAAAWGGTFVVALPSLRAVAGG